MCDWKSVKRVLVVRLRSIGDTVLSTPSLIALRRFLPDAEIDILLEDWVAPILESFGDVDNIITLESGVASRLAVARRIRARKYDIAFNIHGGTTATFFTAASRALHRVGYANYQYSFLYNHLLSSPEKFWGRDDAHSAEQQLALLGYVGVPVDDRPKSRLVVSQSADESVARKLGDIASGAFALLHPTAASKTKEWPTENFARTAEYLDEKGLKVIAVAAESQKAVLDKLAGESRVPIRTFTGLSLPELTALASRARLFVGNDSGIAHIAAAVQTSSVVVFGSSNRDHWRPWTDAPNEVVYQHFDCQPCPGRICEEFGDARCIFTLPPEQVFEAIERVLKASM